MKPLVTNPNLATCILALPPTVKMKQETMAYLSYVVIKTEWNSQARKSNEMGIPMGKEWLSGYEVPTGDVTMYIVPGQAVEGALVEEQDGNLNARNGGYIDKKVQSHLGYPELSEQAIECFSF